MTVAALSSIETRRRAAPRAPGAVAAVSESAFDDLVRLAATLCGTPIALVSLGAGGRQQFEWCYGLDAADRPRDAAFCGHAVLGDDVFEVQDATADGRFAADPLVVGSQHIRFYAGAPLTLPDGGTVGTLSVLDTTPRGLTDAQRDALRVLARQVVAQLRLRCQLAELSRAAEEHETFRVLFEQSSDAHLIFDERDGILDCNHAAVDMLRCRDKSEVLALHPAVLSPEFQPCGRRSLDKCIDMDAAARRDGFHRFDWTHRRADGEDFPCEVTLTPVQLHGRAVLLVVWHDLTDRQRAEDALRRGVARRQRQQEALLALIRNSAGADDRDILAAVARTLEVERASVWHLAHDRSALTCVGLYERGPDRFSAGTVLSAADYPAYFRALTTEEVIAAADAPADPRTREFRDAYLRPLGISAMLDIPLRLAGRVCGVLCLEHVGPPREWTADEQVFALAVGNIRSLMAEQAERRRAEDALRTNEALLTRAFEDAPIGMALVAPDGRWLRVNRSLCSFLGYRPDETLPRDFQAITHPDDLAADLTLVRQVLDGEIPSYQLEKRYFHKDGRTLHAMLSVSLVRDAAGDPLYFVSQIEDIGRRKAAEDALRESEERFRAAMEGSMDAVYFLAAERAADGTVTDFRFTAVNRLGAALVSRPRDEMIGRRLCELLPVNRTDGFIDKYVRVVESGEALEEEFPIAVEGVAADWLHHQVVKVGDGVAITSRDVTARKWAELDLRASEEQLRALGDNLPDGAVFQYVIGPDGRDRFSYMSRGIERLVGRTAAQVQVDAAEMFRLIHPDDARPLADAIRRSQDELSAFDLELRYCPPGWGTRWMHVRSAPHRLPDGGTAWDGVLFDVTDRKRAEDELRANQRQLLTYQQELEEANARLRALAVTDALTGVRNRAAFNDRLTEEFDRAERTGRPLSLLLLDVDHFKQFNDSFGHPAGDAALKAVARALVTTARVTDFVARYGGEEFAVILPDTDIAGALAVAERFRQAVAAVAWRERAVTVSVGVATHSANTADAADLVNQADRALYRCKAAGRNRVLPGSRVIPVRALARTVTGGENGSRTTGGTVDPLQ